MPERTWARCGGICGVLVFVTGFGIVLSLGWMPGSAARTIPEALTEFARPENRLWIMLPDFLLALSAMLGIVTFYALERLLTGGGGDRLHDFARLGALFGTIGFAIVVAKAFVEGTVMVHMGRMYGTATNEAEREMLAGLFRGFRPIERGLHLTYDAFLMLGIALLGWAMIATPRFGRLLGISGVVVGLSILAIRIWSNLVLPPPALASLVGLWWLWLLAVSIQMLRLVRRLPE